MRKHILIILILLTGFKGFAQFKIGFTAGAQLANLRIAGVNIENRFTFNTGFAGRTELAEGIDFHFQLLLSGKGSESNDAYGYNNLFKPLYLELPVAFRFKFNSAKSTKIFIGAGGYYAYGIGGNVVYYQNGYKETYKIDYGNTADDDLQRSDMGLVFQLGAEFRENYEGHFFYDMGLKNIVPNSTTTYYNRVFGFNLTWYF